MSDLPESNETSSRKSRVQPQVPETKADRFIVRNLKAYPGLYVHNGQEIDLPARKFHTVEGKPSLVTSGLEVVKV